MECGCSIDNYYADYGDGPKAFDSKTRTARKEHRCCECHRTIKVGEQYRYESGVWENGPSSHKTCADCASVRDVYFCSFVFGEMWNALHENMTDVGADEWLDGRVNKLTPRARAGVINMVQMEWDREDEENPTRAAWRLLYKTSDANPKGLLPWQRPEWMQRRLREAEDAANACFEA